MSSSNKTEQPTPKRLRDARKKGQVAHSKDWTKTLIIGGLFGYLIAFGGYLGERLAVLLILPGSLYQQNFRLALLNLLHALSYEMIILLLPFLGIVIAVGLLGELSQVGFGLSVEAVTPSFKKLDITQNTKNIFSAKNILEFIKSAIKIIFLSLVIAWLLYRGMGMIFSAPRGGVAGVKWVLGDLMTDMLFYTLLAFLVIAGFDLIWQRNNHRKQLMMSRDEVKQEYKDTEGDPQIKQRRRRLHQELQEGSMPERARMATVLVTNPTHLAVAILYQRQQTPLPVVIAKGEGMMAHEMIRVAQDARVPILQNIPLAHALMRDADIDQYIPSSLIEPVAEVLRAVLQLAQQRQSF